VSPSSAPRSGPALGPRWPKVPPGASSRPTYSQAKATMVGSSATFLERDGAAAARLAHNQEVGGASPPPASNSPPLAVSEASAAISRGRKCSNLPVARNLAGPDAPPFSYSNATYALLT
jgi:hypothetical protein